MIQIELKPEIEARLVAEAHAKGVEPSVYAGSMITHQNIAELWNTMTRPQ